jgi:glycosyltransferase involved in cell wall biosynthesis
VRPDIVHSLEMQNAGYLTLQARRLLADRFPPWVYTNWGADIQYFGRMAEHEGKIREVLEHLDYYTCECERDVELAEEFGFKGEFLPVVPIAGGISLEKIRPWRKPGPTSERRVIMLKGYQGWVYRADVAIEALSKCGEALNGYTLRVYLAAEEIKDMLKKLTRDTGLPHEIVPYRSHEEILREHGQARISIGLSHSDGASTSFLEALAMGSFPIQSNTACAHEYVTDGQSGFIVPPDDPDKVAQAIRRALVDDKLVDQAAQMNWQTAKAKLDHEVVSTLVKDFYEHVHERRLA